MSSFHHILVPTDFGPAAHAALAHATELAEKLDTDLTLMHTYEIPVYVYSEMSYLDTSVITAIETGASRRLDEELTRLRKRLPRAKGVFLSGHPVDNILSAIESSKADLVVMGTHGHRGLRRALLGSVAEKVVRLTPVPVLVVHAGPTEDKEAQTKDSIAKALASVV